MAFVSTETLLLAHLAESESVATLDGLTDTLTQSRGEFSVHVELVSLLDELETAGLISVESDDETATDGEVTLTLTENGEHRAAKRRSDLADRTVTIAGESRTETTASVAADQLDLSLVEFATAVTDDGVYYDHKIETEPCLDREHPRQHCQNAIEALSENYGQAVMITGPAGIGKTTVTEQVIADARDHGVETIQARCTRGEDTPYGPVRALLSQTEHTDPFETSGPGVDTSEAFRAQREALFSDVTSALSPGEPPRLLVVEDLHAADRASKQYLSHLLTEIDSHRLVLVVTARTAELPPEGPFDPDSGATDTLSVIELDPFDRERTRQLIEQLVERRDVPEEFLREVHDRTGGNPLFIEETVRALLDSEKLVPELGVFPADLERIGIPTAIDRTVHRRIDPFPAAVQELLECAVLLGEQFGVPVLGAVCDCSSAKLQTYLELLLDAGVFDRVDPETLVFRSEVVREALLERLDPAQRIEKHRTIASTLADRTDSPPTQQEYSHPEDIARHYDRGERPAEAIEWYQTAGELATDLYAHEHAIEQYHAALELARETEGDTGQADGERNDTVVKLLERLAEIYVITGDVESASQHVEFARERATDTTQQRRLLALAARIDNSRGEFERARERTRNGLAIEDSPDTVTCRLLEQQSEAALGLGELDEATETARRHRTVGKQLDAPREIATAREQLGGVARRKNEYDSAQEHLERAVEVFESLGDRHAVGRAVNELGIIALREGEYDLATARFERALRNHEEVGYELGIAECKNNLGLVALREENHTEARERLEEAVRAYERVGDTHGAGICEYNLSEIALETGDPDRAASHATRALDVGQEGEYGRLTGLARANLGQAALETGAYDEAATHLQSALDLTAEAGTRRDVGKVRLRLGELAVERTNYEHAREQYRAARTAFEEADTPHERAESQKHLAAVARQMADHEKAREHANAALETFREVAATESTVDVLELLVEVTRELDEPDAGIEHCKTAIEVIENAEESYPDRREWFADRRDAINDLHSQ